MEAAQATRELFARIAATPAVHHLAQRVERGSVLSCDGVHASAHPFLAALLRRLCPGRPLVAVTHGLREQEVFQQDLSTWLQALSGEPRKSDTASSAGAPGSQPPISSMSDAAVVSPLFYPPWEILPHEARLPHVDVISERLETLVALGSYRSQAGRPAPIVVTSVEALMQKTFPAAALRSRTRSILQGDRIEPLDLVEWLEDQGYEPEAQVTQKGELALRGGILDLFPLTSPWPVRLEFFGDELESMRFFDPVTQISRDAVRNITIPPAGELGLLKRAQAGEQQAGVEASVRELLAPATLLDHLSHATLFLLSRPNLLEERADEYARQVPDGDRFFLAWKTFREEALARGATWLSVTDSEAKLEPVESPLESELGGESPFQGPRSSGRESAPFCSANEQSRPASAAAGDGCFLRLDSLDAFRPLSERAPEPQVAEAQRREFFAQLHRWLRQGYLVEVFCNTGGERQRFSEIWDEYGLSPESPGDQPQTSSSGPGRSSQTVSTPPRKPGDKGPEPVTRVGTLSRGFICDDAKVVVVTDAEIFGRYKVQRPRRLKSPHAQATRSALDIDFTDLEEGDYVVHLQHGIGRYVGLHVLPVGAGTKPLEGGISPGQPGQECLVLEYAPNDPTQPPPRLYVPVTEAHLVSKYVGTGKVRPPLNTLGGTRWAKAKAQAEKAVRDVASELLSIQAARESQPGHAFAPDAPWQREFEGSFIFEETPDQMRAIVETKLDMERPKPMDRLICGDVGFGKTEVGIRAAFKAVMDGRQVAVLVPTTVLAQQHYNTFRERMADYPVRVELLSRFRTKRAQKKVVTDLAAGAVDIVIGTHRLLQKDIAFKDLGLVVIDEEQRFGVLHKEKFKMLRRLVDVLTLSATPIPRTLYLALTGARDMSTIQTPPHDRLPVETVVTQYDERVIRDAIQRELNRGGQVFFLHNRVMTIMTMAQKIQILVPHARLVVGHGQMHSDELEEVMTTFVNGEADVLLSTTIIESGLDIPNANTIIIDRADRFGLSDLYQLRGRVGRYKHQAYAYLLLPRHAGLLADVRKRLSAIKQYSTLGSGFKIAMRDLEIRGAGNLLGSEQSGHITAVGFDLYCQLLKQSVASLKGEKVKPRIEVQIRLDFLALSPVEERPVPEPKRPTRTAVPGVLDQVELSAVADTPPAPPADRLLPEAAYVPFKYVSDARQRIEIYRKLAQASDKESLQQLEKELRDRFGPLPSPLQLLLRVAELKLMAAERRITLIEVKDQKLMLTRNNDYIMVGSKFPRLTKKDAPGRLKEIRKLLLAL